MAMISFVEMVSVYPICPVLATAETGTYVQRPPRTGAGIGWHNAESGAAPPAADKASRRRRCIGGRDGRNFICNFICNFLPKITDICLNSVMDHKGFLLGFSSPPPRRKSNGRPIGESGAAPPVADAASRFQGSAPFGGHECGRRTAGATRARRPCRKKLPLPPSRWQRQGDSPLADATVHQ